jgi:hypothetical protein
MRGKQNILKHVLRSKNNGPESITLAYALLFSSTFQAGCFQPFDQSSKNRIWQVSKTFLVAQKYALKLSQGFVAKEEVLLYTRRARRPIVESDWQRETPRNRA